VVCLSDLLPPGLPTYVFVTGKPGITLAQFEPFLTSLDRTFAGISRVRVPSGDEREPEGGRVRQRLLLVRPERRSHHDRRYRLDNRRRAFVDPRPIANRRRPADVSDLSCPTEHQCWAAGTEAVSQHVGSVADGSMLLGTTDGGSTWSRVAFSAREARRTTTGSLTSAWDRSTALLRRSVSPSGSGHRARRTFPRIASSCPRRVSGYVDACAFSSGDLGQRQQRWCIMVGPRPRKSLCLATHATAAVRIDDA